MRFALALLLCLPLLVFAPAANAYRASVLPQDATRIDLGTSSSAQLLHLQVRKNADPLEASITLAEDDEALRIKVRVPNQKPESTFTASELPSLRVLTGPSITVEDYAEPIEVGDDSTAIAYLEVGELVVPVSAFDAARKATVEVVPGESSSRMALLVVTDEDSGRLDDAEKIPRTVMRLRGWYDTRLEESKVESEVSEKLGFGEPVVWLPIAISGMAVGIIVWWMISGRSRAKRRGIERYREHHDS